MMNLITPVNIVVALTVVLLIPLYIFFLREKQKNKRAPFDDEDSWWI